MHISHFVSVLVAACLAPACVDARCVHRGNCGIDPVSQKTIPCVYNGKPLPVENASLQLLKSVCPDLVTGQENAFCCDEGNIKDLSDGFTLMRAIVGSCPSCFFNLARVFCDMTCSPHQDTFLEVTAKKPDPDKALVSLNYYMTNTYAKGTFDSCADLQLGGTPVVKTLCWSYADDCIPQTLLQALGNHDETHSPFQVNFVFSENPVESHGRKYEPMDDHFRKCSEPGAPGKAPCGCSTCSESCPEPSYPEPHPPFKIRGHNGYYFLSGMLYVIFLVCVIIAAGLRCCLSSRTGHYGDMSAGSSDEELLNLKGPTTQGGRLERALVRGFAYWGGLCARHPFVVLAASVVFVVACCCGLLLFTIVTDPVELWSAPGSQARIERDLFNKEFGPFYRIQQVVITRNGGQPFDYTVKRKGANFTVTFGAVFERDFLHQVASFQESLLKLNAEHKGQSVHIEDICFSPLGNGECMVQSPLGWFQNNESLLDVPDKDRTYLDHLYYCFSGALSTSDGNFLGLPCLASYGGPVFPYVALGGVSSGQYANASALVLTFLVNNYLDPALVAPAIAWERLFIETLKNFSNPNMSIAFLSESSLGDELNRESQSDVFTVGLSYFIMFLYVSVALGQYRSCKTILVDSQIMLGMSGVAIVLASVASSLGLFSYLGWSATLIIIEVIPFLVLAVGVDNIFILVQGFQREGISGEEPIEDKVSRVVGNLGPSLLLASMSEAACFFLGGLSTMPAVRSFALFAGLALLLDFGLQITCFVALLTLDAKRQRGHRLDLCCCISTSQSELDEEEPSSGFLYGVFEKYYAPALMKPPVRLIVLLVFVGWSCLSLGALSNIKVGLDQEISMPLDSYLQDYFYMQKTVLAVGPPVYFVVQPGYNYTRYDDQSQLCGSSGCSSTSLYAQVRQASTHQNVTTISEPALSWLDDYIAWSSTIDCCQMDNVTGKFCPRQGKRPPSCVPCLSKQKQHDRPVGETFSRFLHEFLGDNPDAGCPKGGHAAYANAVQLYNNDSTKIGATHFMTYHGPLANSGDFVEAIKMARFVSENITITLRNLSSATNATVFPYSIFHVFYEQYLTIVMESVIHIGISMLGILAITFLLLDLNVGASLVIFMTILMILVDLLGIMYFWGIDLNAVSLVNLVMAVGISVEFCSHIVRAFLVSPYQKRVERSQDALARMGSSVLSGITLTKFGGVIVLAFSKSQLFRIFYFRMYLSIVLVGAAHGLIFLPALLSFVGPASTSTPKKPRVATE